MIEPHPEKYSPDALDVQISSCVNHQPRLVRGWFLFEVFYLVRYDETSTHCS
ncbi:MAG: hypothetical protein RL591_1130 [Planctomycetota bacterium]|jgi:hypothetical protein